MARAVRSRFSLASLPVIIFGKIGRHAGPDEVLEGLSRHPDEFVDIHPDPPTIMVDVRKRGRGRLETIIHESMHLVFPAVEEEKIRRAARYIAMVVWHLGYRADEHEHEEKFYQPEDQ